MDDMFYGVVPEEEYLNVPEGHYLVMGDNSANSRDGRYFIARLNGSVKYPLLQPFLI